MKMQLILNCLIKDASPFRDWRQKSKKLEAVQAFSHSLFQARAFRHGFSILNFELVYFELGAQRR